MPGPGALKVAHDLYHAYKHDQDLVKQILARSLRNLQVEIAHLTKEHDNAMTKDKQRIANLESAIRTLLDSVPVDQDGNIDKTNNHPAWQAFNVLTFNTPCGFAQCQLARGCQGHTETQG